MNHIKIDLGIEFVFKRILWDFSINNLSSEPNNAYSAIQCPHSNILCQYITVFCHIAPSLVHIVIQLPHSIIVRINTTKQCQYRFKLCVHGAKESPMCNILASQNHTVSTKRHTVPTQIKQCSKCQTLPIQSYSNAIVPQINITISRRRPPLTPCTQAGDELCIVQQVLLISTDRSW